MQTNADSRPDHQPNKVPALVEFQGPLQVVAHQEQCLHQLQVPTLEDIGEDERSSARDEWRGGGQHVLFSNCVTELATKSKCEVEQRVPGWPRGRLGHMRPHALVFHPEAALVHEGVERMNPAEVRIHQTISQMPFGQFRTHVGRGKTHIDAHRLCTGDVRDPILCLAGQVHPVLLLRLGLDLGDEGKGRRVAKVLVGSARSPYGRGVGAVIVKLGLFTVARHAAAHLVGSSVSR